MDALRRAKWKRLTNAWGGVCSRWTCAQNAEMASDPPYRWSSAMTAIKGVLMGAPHSAPLSLASFAWGGVQTAVTGARCVATGSESPLAFAMTETMSQYVCEEGGC
jgi:hypothetical protein